MKRLFVVAVLFALAVSVTPLAQAQSCSQYACRLGNCPWYELVIDGAFTSPSCNAWSYTGGGSLSSGDICNGTNIAYGQIVYNGGFQHTGTITQTFPTRNGANDLDNFSFQYTIEITNMTPGDTVKVTLTDTTTGTKITTDTFTADTWCNNVTHNYNSAGWKGHSLTAKWSATLASTGTVVKVTPVAMWQQYQ